MMRPIMSPVLSSILQPVMMVPDSPTGFLPGGTQTVAARGSVWFDGVDDYYEFTDAAGLDLPNGDWTIGCLYHAQRVSTKTHNIFGHGAAGGANSWRFEVNTANMRIYLNPGSGAFTSPTDLTMTAGLWYILAARRTGSTIQCVRVPVNGSALVSATTGTLSAAITPSGVGRIGARLDGNSTTFLENAVSYVFKINSALSNAQLEALAAGQDLITDLGLSPQVYFRLDSAASTINDSGSSGSVATRQSTPMSRGAPDWSGQPIRITQTQDAVLGRVYQRTKGKTTRDALTFTGTYNGTPANGMEARVITANNTEVVGWTDCTNPSAGNWAVTLPNVPQGGQYALEVRFKGDTTKFNRTVRPFGVGMIVMMAGESIAAQMGVGSWFESGFSPNAYNLMAYDGANAVYCDILNGTTGIMVQIIERMRATLNIPVGVVNAGYSGSELYTASPVNWSTPGSLMRLRYTACVAVVGDAEFLLWVQGVNDAEDGTPPSTAQYQGALETLAPALRSELGRTASELPFGIAILGRRQSGSAVVPGSWRLVRNAHYNCLGTITNAFDAGCLHDCSMSDAYHYDNNGYIRIAKRYAQAMLFFMGALSTGMRGATPVSVSRSGNNIDITFALNNGTTLQGLTGATGLTGFEVRDSGGTAKTISATAIPSSNTVRLTLSSAAAAGDTVDYNKDDTMTVTNQLYTNATVIADTVGVPARPWAGPLTLT